MLRSRSRVLAAGMLDPYEYRGKLTRSFDATAIHLRGLSRRQTGFFRVASHWSYLAPSIDVILEFLLPRRELASHCSEPCPIFWSGWSHTTHRPGSSC